MLKEEIKINPTQFSKIPADLMEKAKNERLTFLNSKNIYYWAAFTADDKCVGVASVKLFKNSAMFKSLFIEPEFRRCGIAGRLYNARLQFIRRQNIPVCYCFALPLTREWYLREGWEIIISYRASWKMRLALI